MGVILLPLCLCVEGKLNLRELGYQSKSYRFICLGMQIANYVSAFFINRP